MKKAMGLLLTAVMMVSIFAGCSNASAATFDTSKPINVISREDGSGTRGAFIELFGVEVKDDAGNKTDMTKGEAEIVNNTEVMLTSVEGDTYAIGYVSLGSLNDKVKAVQIDAVDATTENVKNGTYKISRPFNIATNGTPSEVTQDFIDYILSKQGQEIVGKSYITIDDSAADYAGTKPEGKIVIAGSSSVTPIMEKLIEAYKLVNENATIELQTSDSTTGMTAAIDGTCDIGMASRELKDSEKESLTATVIALDGIAVIVNSANTNTNLTSEQVRQIYTGEAETWTLG